MRLTNGIVKWTAIALMSGAAWGALPDGLKFKSYYDASATRFPEVCWFGEIPGKPGNLLMAMKNGQMHVLTPTTASATAFGTLPVENVAEAGLMGMAFHPRFTENRRIFAYAYLPNSSPNKGTHIVELSADASLTRLSGAAPKLILYIPEMVTPGHQGSSLQFGPDGMLYLAIGDNLTQGQGTQSRESFHGTVIRIDINRQDAGKNYAIPTDNPFVKDPNPKVRKEIWAHGFRNPWKISFDPLTGDLWMGMVGGWIQDYVTIVRKGDNLGWPILEGTTCFNGSSDLHDHGAPLASCNRTGLVEPIIPMPHKDTKANQSNCLIGGVVYRANPKSAFYGAYFFFDTISRQLWAATQKDRSLTELKEYPRPEGVYTHFMVDSQGNLLAVDYYSGKVYMGDHPELRLGSVPVSLHGSMRRPVAPRKVAVLGGPGNQAPPGSRIFSVTGTEVKSTVSPVNPDGARRPSRVPVGVYLLR